MKPGPLTWRGSAWAMSAAVVMLSIGINTLTYVDDPREIRQFTGGVLVTYGLGILAIMVWQLLTAPPDNETRKDPP